MLALLFVAAMAFAAPSDASPFDHGLSKRQNSEELWANYKQKFQKGFDGPLDELKHFYTFSQNYIRVLQHNLKFERGETSYQMGVNQFSDRSAEELQHLFGYNASAEAYTRGSSAYIPKNFMGPLPKKVDWRTKGAVTPVLNQGKCGSCWAFSATGALEAQHFLKTGELVSLSKQQLVDCSSKYGNEGCEGGFMSNAFNYLIHEGGAESEDSYPYLSGSTGKADDECFFSQEEVVADVTGYSSLPKGDEKVLQEVVATIGPVSVAIHSSLDTFIHYEGGVYDDPKCTSDKVDHAVLVVGYGTEKDKDYWLVKNSWDTTWGQNGYAKIRRNYNNLCGIASYAVYPLV